MASETKQYTVEFTSGYAEWWRYNIYIMAVGYDRSGNRISFANISDKIYDACYDEPARVAPADYDPARCVAVTTPPCDWVEIYVYVVANTFPSSPVIRDSPSFKAEMTVKADGRTIQNKTYEVNQWGGLTIVAHKVGIQG